MPCAQDVASSVLRHKIEKGLNESFEAVERKGSFAAQDALYNDPGVYVEGIGKISVPPSTQDVQRLIALSRQAPFGKNSETIVDTSIRNTWEIDASRVQLKGRSWEFYKGQTVDRVCGKLGVFGRAANVRADLYKLLIYEPGAMFKPHQDTEKAEGMFGTMVIALPYPHQGGDVVVSFNGQHKLLSTSTKRPWDPKHKSYEVLAWYSDVVHEVRPVVSGYRIVLTFNLIHTGSMPAPLRLSTSTWTQALRDILHLWKSAPSEGKTGPKHLVWLLDHQYSESSLRLDRLKGTDFTRVQGIASILQETGFVCYLASLEKMITGQTAFDPSDMAPWRDHYRHFDGDGSEEEEEEGDESDGEGPHAIDEVLDEELKVENLVDLNGEPADIDIEIEDCDILQDSPFLGNDPDEETDYSGYTGNEGVSATHWYRPSALVIMPRDDDEEEEEEVETGVAEKEEEEEVRQIATRSDEPIGTKRGREEEGDEENRPPPKRIAVIDLCESP